MLRTRLKDAVASIGAPNEPEHARRPEPLDRQDARLPARALDASQGRPRSPKGVPVLGPAVAQDHSEAPPWGTCPPTWTRGTSIRTPAAGPRCTTSRSERADASLALSGGKPLVATEIGYHSDLATTSAHHPTSERAIGYDMPRSALEGFRNGVERSYIYRLLDPWSPAEADARRLSATMENPSACCAGTCRASQALLGLSGI